jgi:hypothetical protein
VPVWNSGTKEVPVWYTCKYRPFRALFLAEDETPCSADSYQLSARCSLLDTAFQSMKALLSKGENGIVWCTAMLLNLEQSDTLLNFYFWQECIREVNLSFCVTACREYTNELPLRVNPFIINGKDAEPGDYPHMVSSRVTGQDTFQGRWRMRVWGASADRNVVSVRQKVTAKKTKTNSDGFIALFLQRTSCITRESDNNIIESKSCTDLSSSDLCSKRRISKTNRSISLHSFY